MSVSTLFLGPRSRFAESLIRFDPLKGEPLLRLLDPVPPNMPSSKQAGGIPFIRLLVFSGIIILPEVICSLIDNPTLGGRFWTVERGVPCRTGALCNSIGTLSQFLIFVPCVLLILIGRRLMGNLLGELKESRVVVLPQNLDISRHEGGWFLCVAEWITRPTLLLCAAWLIVMVLVQAMYYHQFLSDAKPSWLTSKATQGSVFFFLHVGEEQPNLAGFFHQCLFSAVLSYVIFLAVRLFIVFACICQMIADHKPSRILPTDPDRTGGLLPVGQVSLFLSMFTLMAGFALTGLTLQTIREAIASHTPFPEQGLFAGLLTLWTMYLLLGPLLLFLPLWPLRAVMAHAKREYLHGAKRLYQEADQKHRAHIEEQLFKSDALQGQASLASLIEAAGEMSVWPFDRRTLLRFAGVMLSPLIPLVTSEWPTIVIWFEKYMFPT